MGLMSVTGHPGTPPVKTGSPLSDAIDDVLAWRHLRERGMVQPLWNPLSGGEVDAMAPGLPVKFSATPRGIEAGGACARGLCHPRVNSEFSLNKI